MPLPEFVVREIPVSQTRQLRHAILRPHQATEELAAHEMPGAFAVGAFAGPELISVGFVGPDGGRGSWRVRGMATTPDSRGRGAGGEVLQRLVRHAVDHGATRVWCNARIGARSLYERAGFSVTSEEFEVPDIGPHVVMERTIADAAAAHD